MVAAIVAAFLTGMLAPKSAAAVSVSFTMELWPGGGSTLTCGWHLSACYDNDALVTSGGALDWAYAGAGTITFTLRSYPDHTTCNVDDAPVTNNVTDCWVGASYKQGDRTWWLPYP